MPHVIVIGSTSRIKIEAVRDALIASGVRATLVPHPAASGVPAQPVGREQTLLGARNRARRARESCIGAWGVGIENGLIHEDGRWSDIAAVVIISPEGRETVGWSEAVAVPDGYVARAEAEGFGVTTVGAIIARDLGSSPDDPHSALTAGRLSRSALLRSAAAETFTAAIEGKGGGT